MYVAEAEGWERSRAAVIPPTPPPAPTQRHGAFQNENLARNLVGQLVLDQAPLRHNAAGFGEARNRPAEYLVVSVRSVWYEKNPIFGGRVFCS